MTRNATETPARVGLVSLGCAKNLADAEVMLGALLREGLEITNDTRRADALIVNTCSFIDSAQEESVDTILELAALRERHHRQQALIVSGCLPQRFREELPRLLPEVDAFMGVDQVRQAAQIVQQALARRAAKLSQTAGSKIHPPAIIPGGNPVPIARRRETRNSELETRNPKPETQDPKPETPELNAPVNVSPRPTYVPDYAAPRFRLTPRHYAYVKIAEGCNHPCSFCIIPRIRGSHRSRPVPDIVAEARALLADGVRELNLISQDSTYYGLDLRAHHSRAVSSPEKFGAAVRSLSAGSTTICTLLRRLNALPGRFWIRLLYTHPAHWTDELIQTIAECPKVARYLDIPLQHIHDNMLERMRRETSREYIVNLLQRIRAGVPGVALRTTFIVGFPGETEEYFKALLDFIAETRFERLGVFTYSREEGTRAGAMAGQIPEAVKQRRRARAMAAQRRVAGELSRSQVGRILTVLIERPADRGRLRRAQVRSWEHGWLRETGSRISHPRSQMCMVARGEADAPEIDGRVYVRGRLAPGEFARVRIVGHTDYDLLAVPA